MPCCGGFTLAVVILQGWATIFLQNYVTVFHVIVPWLGMSLLGVLNFVAFQTVVVIAFTAHVRAAFTSPGCVALNSVCN